MNLDEQMAAGTDSCPIPTQAQAPADDLMALILARSKAVAIVGASPSPERTSHAVTLWLMNNTPFELYLVNPRAGDADIEGHGFYASLAEVPVTPDIVVAFRKSEDMPPVADDAVAADATVLWMQLGIQNELAAATARAAGLEVVENRCIKIEYSRLRERIEAATLS